MRPTINPHHGCPICARLPCNSEDGCCRSEGKSCSGIHTCFRDNIPLRLRSFTEEAPVARECDTNPKDGHKIQHEGRAVCGIRATHVGIVRKSWPPSGPCSAVQGGNMGCQCLSSCLRCDGEPQSCRRWSTSARLAMRSFSTYWKTVGGIVRMKQTPVIPWRRVQWDTCNKGIVSLSLQ